MPHGGKRPFRVMLRSAAAPDFPDTTSGHHHPLLPPHPLMKNNQTSAQSPQDLLDDLHALVAEAEKMMGESAPEATADIVSTLRQRYDAAQERLGEIYETTRQRVVAGAKCTDTAIRENPYQSLAIAAGVGLLVGVLLGRRSR